MPAYLIVDLDIHDEKTFEEYRAQVPPMVAKYGGEYLVRGGGFEVIEGDWTPHRLVLFRFPNRQAIQDHFADPEYRRIAEVRFRSAKTVVIAVDGIA
jgi:uncharacterized protein (DUF1330 family)